MQVIGNHSLSYMYAGRFVSGLGVGAFSVLAPTYVVESGKVATAKDVSH